MLTMTMKLMPRYRDAGALVALGFHPLLGQIHADDLRQSFEQIRC